MKGIMIQGCSSDAGKSYVTTALCRILSDLGYKVAPFKSQNMSNNSFVTWDGKEIGRAQGVQAEAARVVPQSYMNPILLKPKQDQGSEVLLFGEVFDTLSGKSYQKDFTLTVGMNAVRKAIAILEETYDTVVVEGAGSPAEVNLNRTEIVNMRIAAEFDIPVILVVDINRGGSFASIVGTLELVGADRSRIKGILFNQFRGDLSLFEDGKKWIEEYTGVKVVGVLPYFSDIFIEGEDSVSLNYEKAGDHEITLGVVHLPFISNHTDMEIFQYEEDVSVRRIKATDDLCQYDAIIVPGTKSTIGDLTFIENNGIAKKLKDYQGFIFGICGGYQMLGESLFDETGVDIAIGYEKEGLGLLPMKTRFLADKSVSQVEAVGLHPLIAGMKAEGYEIHLGQSEGDKEGYLPIWKIGGKSEGMADRNFHVGGSYLHNIFHNDEFRTFWLNLIRKKKGVAIRSPLNTMEFKDRQYDLLAAGAREHLDIDYILELIAGSGKK